MQRLKELVEVHRAVSRLVWWLMHRASPSAGRWALVFLLRGQRPSSVGGVTGHLGAGSRLKVQLLGSLDKQEAGAWQVLAGLKGGVGEPLLPAPLLDGTD